MDAQRKYTMTRIMAGAVLVLCIETWLGSPHAAQAQDAPAADQDASATPSAAAELAESDDAAGDEPAAENSDKPAGESKAGDKADATSNSGDKSAEKPAEKPAEKSDESSSAPSSTRDRSRGDMRSGRGSRDSGSDRRTGPTDAKAIIGDFSPSSGAAKRDGNNSRQKLLSFKFVKAPWTMVLEKFAKEADLTLDPDETPPGTFTYTDDRLFTPTEALDVINGYLLKRGFLLIRRDQFLVVWNIDSPPPPNLVPLVSVDDLAKRGRNEYVSVLLQVPSSVDAKVVADEASESSPEKQSDQGVGHRFEPDSGQKVYRRLYDAATGQGDDISIVRAGTHLGKRSRATIARAVRLARPRLGRESGR
jgi:hypothetical protein